MKLRYEEFNGSYGYENNLVNLHEEGNLPVDTVTDDERRGMLMAVLTDEPTPGTYLEIGPGGDPYFTQSNRQFGDGVRYLGIDGGSSEYIHPEHSGWTDFNRPGADMNMHDAARSIAEHPASESGAVMWADAQQLPLADYNEQSPQTVRETFMRDVLMQPGVHPRSMEQISNEQARILGRAGQLVIRETYFLGYKPETDTPTTTFLSLVASLEQAGFTKRAMVKADAPAFPLLRNRFPGGMDRSRVSADGYYLLSQLGEMSPESPPRKMPGWFSRAVGRLGVAGRQ